ncbi:MAG: toprim domain-containing protein [bacterium]
MDALAVIVASGGMLAGVSPLGTALTTARAAQRAAALPTGSDRVVVANDADRGGRQAAGRVYELLTRHGLDPRAAALPGGLDPTATLTMHGPAVLMSRLTGAEPMGRQLLDQALRGRDLTWLEDRVAAARIAAGVIVHPPPSTWER